MLIFAGCNPYIFAFFGYALDYARPIKFRCFHLPYPFTSYIDYYFKMQLLIDAIKAFVISRNKSFYNGCDMVLVPSSQSLKNWVATALIKPGWWSGQRVWIPPCSHLIRMQVYYLKKTSISRWCCLSADWYGKNLLTLKDIYLLNEAAEQSISVCNRRWWRGARWVAKQSMPNALFLGSLQHEALSQWYATLRFCLHQKQKLTGSNQAMASDCRCCGGCRRTAISWCLIENGIKCTPKDAPAFYEAVKHVLTDKVPRENHSKWSPLQKI